MCFNIHTKTLLGANLSVRFFFGGAWFRNLVSVSVSGLILPKAFFDVHVSVSCLFGPKDADHLSDHVHGKILGPMSVSGFITENS